MPDWKNEIRRRLASSQLSPMREAAIVEELAQYLDDCYAESLSSGATEEEAYRAALAELSESELLQRELRRVERRVTQEHIVPGTNRRSNMIADLWQDLRFGARMLRKQPGFTLIAVLTLALGIGATAAIFSVVNGVLLRPLPYEEPDRLVLLHEYDTKAGKMSLSYPNFADWRAQNRVFEKIGVYNYENYILTGSGEAERLRTAQMSADVFDALRVKAALGRVYTNVEDKPGASPVVVLSHGLWQRRFGGDASIVGRTLTLNDRSYTVIGVMPQGLLFPDRVEMWAPAGLFSDQNGWNYRGRHPGLAAVARLKPGVTLEQAREEMKLVTAALEKQYPDSNRGHSATLIPLLENYVRDIRRALYLLLGAVGFVLLIACANVASLTLARAATRQKEMAVRIALGASRARIVRQLLAESLLLALVGGSLGLLIARWGITAMLAISPEGALPRAGEIHPDTGVLLFTAAVSILTGVIFGLAPALQASRSDVQETLKETRHTATGRWPWLRSGMVVTEIALTLVLLLGAGLLMRSFFRLQQVNPGFAADSTLSFKVSLPKRKSPDTALDQRINFFNQVREKIETLPGVQSVGLSSGLPLGHNSSQWSFSIVGQPVPAPEHLPSMEFCVADIGYFETMRIPLVRGRWFNEQDNRSHVALEALRGLPPFVQLIAGLRTIIIDEEFARRHFPNEDPIGKQIRLGSNAKDLAVTVVGIVGRVKMEGLRHNSDRVQGYFPFQQFPFSDMTFTVRTPLQPEQLTASVRQQVAAVDPAQPIYGVRTLAEIRAKSVAAERLNLILLGVFAAVALVLALVGIYGVISWSVTQRTHEIGVRMALGAHTGDVLRLFVGQGMKLVGVGIGLGLAGALLLTRLMAALLFEVSVTDPVTFAVAALLLMIVALFACWLPARRATQVDPMVALRIE